MITRSMKKKAEIQNIQILPKKTQQPPPNDDNDIDDDNDNDNDDVDEYGNIKDLIDYDYEPSTPEKKKK